MMTIKDFEAKIKEEIDSDLSIKINPNANDIAGVYYKTHYLGVAVPPNEIHEEISTSRADSLGQPYKNISFATDLIIGKLEKIKKAIEENPDLFE